MGFSQIQRDGFSARVVSAVVLIGLLSAALLGGAVSFGFALFLAGLLAAWEWAELVQGRVVFRRCTIMMTSMVALVLLVALAGYVVTAGLIFILGLVIQWVLNRGRDGLAWLLFGTFYICASFLALDWLHGRPEMGLGLVVWLFFVVCATDIGAYFVGQLIGGAKILPRVSPNKTWAGLFGGMFFAALFSGLVGDYFDLSAKIGLVVIGALLAVVAQAGDFLESYLKRQAGKKDSGTLIPGHGGLLDRIDSVMSASLAVAALQVTGVLS